MVAETAVVCPKCGYARKRTDAGPEWQCAACGIALHKVRELAAEAQVLGISNAVPAIRPPRTPLALRAMAALPDLSTAGVFLWCWIAPNAWRKSLPGELATLMFMQFFVMHASIILTFASPSASIGARIIGGAVVFAFYTPIVGVISYLHGDWLPFVAFAWLLFSQIAALISGDGPEDFQVKRQRYYWSRSAGYYLIVAFVVLLFLPIPSCGMRDADMSASVVHWTINRQDVMAWGTLYFGWLGLLRLFEKPEWIDHSADEFE